MRTASSDLGGSFGGGGLELAEQQYHVQQAGFEDVFIWQAEGDVMEWSTYSVPASVNYERSIEDIAVEELRIAASIIDAADPALEVAWLLRSGGLQRLRDDDRADAGEPW